MSKHAQKSYFECIRERYHAANKTKKGLILEEFCENYGYNRKYAIRKLNKPVKHKKVSHSSKKGRPLYEKEKLLPILLDLWLATNQLCSKKLKVALPEWLPYYESENIDLAEIDLGALYRLSPSTIDRWLASYRRDYPLQKGLSGTKPGTLLKNQIPVKTDHWDVTQPGFLEADTVAHCGNSLAGDFVWSITYTDIFSTWTETRATWNKGGEGVKRQTEHMEQHLPFPILGFDCDNGSEFLNWHLVRYFTERTESPVQFTRSRPYHKNDNAHVEQKNWTHVRQLFGYHRFEDRQLVDLMNDVYQNEWSDYQNHFRPTMKLKEKIKINSRYRKKYDEPQTPYQRLMNSSHISESKKQELKMRHKALNPFELKMIIDQKVRHILHLASVTFSMSQRS